MNRYLLILILTFSFQSLPKADDIKDFEIEGVSLGDSLLDHFSKDQIVNNNLKANYKNKSIEGLLFQNIDFIVNYDAMQFVYKVKNMEIINITALTKTGSDINLCKKKKNEVILDLTNIFVNIERSDEKKNHPADISGSSKVISTFLNFKNDDFVAVECEQWSKKMDNPNVLKVSLRTNLYNDILIEEYK